jgi:hypothetical protein
VSRTAGRLLLEAEFRELARRVAEGAASERRPVYVPLRVTLRFGSPVVLTHPYVMLDGVIGHCMLPEYLGEDLYHVWAVKTPFRNPWNVLPRTPSCFIDPWLVDRPPEEPFRRRRNLHRRPFRGNSR